MTMFQNLHRSMSFADRLKIRCELCGHQAALTAAEARARCGPDATPMLIRRRARCSACGAKGSVQVWI